MRRKGLCVTVVIGFSLIWGQGLQADEGLALEKLPEAVQKTIREHRNGVEPSALSREESEGSIFYEAEYLQGDVKHEVKTDEEGRIVEIEEELPLSHLPKAALESIQVAYPGAEIEEVELKTLTHYDIEINLDGKEVNVRILESGYLLQSDSDEVDDEEADEADEEEESEVTWAQLPETVREAIEEHRRGIQPSKFERMEVDGRTFYEAEYE